MTPHPKQDSHEERKSHIVLFTYHEENSFTRIKKMHCFCTTVRSSMILILLNMHPQFQRAWLVHWSNW
jgi:hypothetical protein